MAAFTFYLFTFLPFHPTFAQPGQAQPIQPGQAQPILPWHTAKGSGFIVQTASNQDQRYLSAIFEALRQARKDLAGWGLGAPPTVRVVVHPNLQSFTNTARVPWFVMAASNRAKNRMDTQRVRILLERGTLERTLRHELFHLAQPQGWPRWKAEGMAMRFAGDRPSGKPLENISPVQLDRLLANPPSQAMLARAMATAYAWAGAGSGMQTKLP